MVARDGAEPPTPAFSDVEQQALPTTYKSRETAEVPGNSCKPTQLLTRIADRPLILAHLFNPFNSTNEILAHIRPFTLGTKAE